MRGFTLPLALGAIVLAGACRSSVEKVPASAAGALSGVALAQPGWSRDDLEFFLHGSMSTELVPEVVLRAFILAYPDLFPSADLGHLGLIPDPVFGWPIGFSRARVRHLADLPSVGVNCASCHVGEVIPPEGGPPVRVLGMTSHFDAEAFFGAVAAATYRTAAPGDMRRFLSAYLAACDPDAGAAGEALLASAWDRQEAETGKALAAGAASGGTLPGGFHDLSPRDLELNRRVLAAGLDVPALAGSLLRLFHNIRTAVHIPHEPPRELPPASGPGRNDAFGLLSAVFFAAPQPPAPVKYGLVWNTGKRRWVHWDGNTQSPIGRNLLASLGLGAPLVGRAGKLDLALIQRQTALSEKIAAPRYPFGIDEGVARRGEMHYRAHCASCHDGEEDDRRLHSPGAIGTDPRRAQLFTQLQADRFNAFLAGLEIPGYVPAAEPGMRGTGKYWAASLQGVWARSPYLHNGSVRTLEDLLLPPAQRPRSFRRGSRVYDAARMGYTGEGSHLLDTAGPGNSSAGHDYGTGLSGAEKRELIEYLKTL